MTFIIIVFDCYFTQLQNILSKYVFSFIKKKKKYVQQELLDPESKNGPTFTDRDATA